MLARPPAVEVLSQRCISRAARSASTDAPSVEATLPPRATPRKSPMSFYFIGNPDPKNAHRWIYSTSVNATTAIFDALHRAGFQVVLLKTTESVSPYLEELDISKRGAKREDVEAICARADPGPAPQGPPKGPQGRFAR